MIKQFTFVNRQPDLSAAAFPGLLHEVFRPRAGAPLPARPLRAALCTALPGEGPPPRHDAVSLEWFEDEAHLERFEEWRSAAAPTQRSAGPLEASRPGTVVVATEVVRRGADWLRARWSEGGPKFKHMALARRADHLTPAEFSRRWQAHAGTISRSGAAGDLVIPDDARGLAYVQDHPVPRREGGWAYDAVNEAYFDDLAGLQLRAGWFEQNVGRDAQEDLVGDRWFLCVREDVLVAA